MLLILPQTRGNAGLSTAIDRAGSTNTPSEATHRFEDGDARSHSPSIYAPGVAHRRFSTT